VSNELLPTRLNAEPSIFRGCSLSELMSLTITGALVCVPFWLIVCALFKMVMVGVGIGVLSILGWVFVGATILQKMKRGRPIGFYQLKIRLLLEDKGLRKTPFIRKSQSWGIGRSL
jgi:conjugative transfer region protein (TIGR03750 family)